MQDKRERIIIRTSVIGILGNLLLVVSKAIIGVIASSIAIILDAINNLSDALSSILTIIGTKLANKKPTKKHPFGFGRIEYLTSTIIAMLVLFAGISAIKESIEVLISGSETNYNYVTIIIISIAIVIKIALGLYFKKKGKEVKSDALIGSGVDALFDSILSLSTLIAIVVNLIWKINIEGYLGIIIGLFILKSGFEILKDALSDIIGKSASSEISEAIKEKVLSFDGVNGAYDLIINNYGPNKSIASIHIEVSDDMNAKDIHVLTRKITECIYLEFGIIITVGIYAENNSDGEISLIKEDVFKVSIEYNNVKQVHGFYADSENKLISFDLVIDFNCDHEKIKNEIINKTTRRLCLKLLNVLLTDTIGVLKSCITLNASG